MTTLTYSEARNGLAELWNKVESDREPVELVRRGHETLAILPASELSALMETAHLLRSPENARRLFASMERARRGELKAVTMDELHKMVEG